MNLGEPIGEPSRQGLQLDSISQPKVNLRWLYESFWQSQINRKLISCLSLDATLNCRSFGTSTDIQLQQISEEWNK
ncbi:hypothetical protein AMR42_10630 [Limnothrix sp. PR1529]|nr:hypothetical protein BCR12_12655 [Limnothrix sp. P13C2]PIB10082.1 hypothetical protein AMR42_10630 [Limnothrix sp. PR1529]